MYFLVGMCTFIADSNEKLIPLQEQKTESMQKKKNKDLESRL